MAAIAAQAQLKRSRSGRREAIFRHVRSRTVSDSMARSVLHGLLWQIM